jgi:hypothetical protein
MTRLRAVLSVLLMLAGVGVVGAAPAAAVALPGGKANYVVSTGSLYAEYGANWVRLGTYVFSADGRIRARTWVWSQQDPVGRVGTGTTPSGACSGTSTTVRPCEVLTAEGFTAAAPELRFGSYTLHQDASGRSFVNIAWDIATWRSEEWWVDVSTDATYARLTFKYSQKFNHGYGYGSNAAFETRRAMETVRNHAAPLRMNYHRASQGQVLYTDSAWNTGIYVQCTTTTWCLTYKIPQASGTSCRCAAPHDTDHSIQNVIQKVGNADRRDTFWHWCTCLAKTSPCYVGNSHVYPLLQAIDDRGNWRGWVGVEAAFYPYTDGIPRKADMLSVFRVAEWV